MTRISFTFAILLTIISLGNIATSQTLHNDPNRPTDLIAAEFDISETVFLTCFSDVVLARDHAPSQMAVRVNKAVLLPCLQTENPNITNASLDAVMDKYRPEG